MAWNRLFFGGMFGRNLERGEVSIPIVLYTRDDCGLCAEMKSDLAKLRLGHAYQLREVDIDRDAELKDRYGWRVPVLEVAGELVCEGRLEPALFRKRFAKIARRYRLEILEGKNC